MDPVDLALISQCVGGRPSRALARDDSARRVIVNSKHAQSGDVFFALPGLQTHGRVFAREAVERGAVAVVLSEADQSDDLDSLPLIVVDDVMASLWSLAKWWRSQLRAKFLVIAGSIGKTTTKSALASILNKSGYAYVSPGSYNSRLGVALSVINCPSEADLAVFEVAVTEPGAMREFVELLSPNFAVVTNVTRRHRTAFGGEDVQCREFLSVTSGMDDEDCWFLTGEARLLRLYQGRARLGVATASADVHPNSMTEDAVMKPVPGAESGAVADSLRLAGSAAELLGLDTKTIAEVLSQYRLPATSVEIWHSPAGVAVMRDTAVADLVALQAGITTAMSLRSPSGRLVVALTGFSGSPDAQSVRELGALLAEHSDFLLGVDRPVERQLVDAARAQGCTNAALRSDIKDLRDLLLAYCRPGDVVLVESAGHLGVAELASDLMEEMATTRLVVDLAAVESNVGAIKALVGPTVRIMAVVKAQAYGTQSASTVLAQHLQSMGIDSFAVATPDEGIELRRSGITLPILVLLGGVHEMDKMVRHQLTPLVYSNEMLDAAIVHSERSAITLPLHLEVDSGMHRTGLSEAEAIKCLERIRDIPQLRLVGLMTHLACAEDPEKDDFTSRQLATFDRVIARMMELGLEGVACHAANTAGAIRIPRARHDIVRIGIGICGLYSSVALRDEVSFVPALRLVTRLAEVYEVEGGDLVGYGGKYEVPDGGARLGVVPVGYNDVVPRSFSESGYVLIEGQRCRVVGNVAMDSFMVDVSEVPYARVGSDVVIYGRQGSEEIAMEDVAESLGTISWELMTRIGARVQRIFVRY